MTGPTGGQVNPEGPQGAWSKVKEWAGGTPGAAAIMGGFALANRMLSVNALNKRMDRVEDRQLKMYSAQKFQNLVLKSLAAKQGIEVPMDEGLD